MMTRYHAVMLDETGCEFGVDVDAPTKEAACKMLRDDYPESSIDQLESIDEARQREAEMHAHIARGGDWDDEGRPIFPGGYEEDEDDDQDD